MRYLAAASGISVPSASRQRSTLACANETPMRPTRQTLPASMPRPMQLQAVAPERLGAHPGVVDAIGHAHEVELGEVVRNLDEHAQAEALEPSSQGGVELGVPPPRSLQAPLVDEHGDAPERRDAMIPDPP